MADVLFVFVTGLILLNLAWITTIIQGKLEGFFAFIAIIGWSVGIVMVILSNVLLIISKLPGVAG